MIKVSVLIPAYNVQNFIEKCVRSVLDQTLKEIEIIVVNDGSSDKTQDVLNSILDPRLKIINQNNQGVSVARNVGLDASKGEFIFQLDGDDWIENSALFDMYQTAVLENADILITDAYFDYEKKITLFQGAINLSGDNVQDFLLGRISPNVWTKLFKRSLFKENSIAYSPNISIGEDLVINLELFFFAKKISRLNKAYVHYMQRDDGLTKVYSERLLQVYDMMNLVRLFLLTNKIIDRYADEVECLEYQHTYYYRILVDTNSRIIHRKFYDVGKNKYNSYLKNKFVINFLDGKSKWEQKNERLFRLNYYFGCFQLRLTKYFDTFIFLIK